MGKTVYINTLDIVASNLTVAYFSTRQQIADEEKTEEKIIEVYRRFQELLKPKGDRYDPNEGGSWTQQDY